MKILILIIMLLILSACGSNPPQAPQGSPPSDPTIGGGTVDPGTGGGGTTDPGTGGGGTTPTVTTLTFTALQGFQICHALQNWDETTQIIRFPTTVNGLAFYTFRADGVFTISPTTTVSSGNHSIGFQPYCTVIIANGEFVSAL